MSRLIDVDALINEIKKETEKAIKQDDRVGAFWLGYFAGLVLELPTIQPEKDTTFGMISIQQAIDALRTCYDTETISMDNGDEYINYGDAVGGIEQLPSVQPERDIPKKPNETTDRTWGIPHRQAVCPNCDAYLGMIHFISENGKTKVTYCESCGQAIDWEGWKEDE